MRFFFRETCAEITKHDPYSSDETCPGRGALPEPSNYFACKYVSLVMMMSLWGGEPISRRLQPQCGVVNGRRCASETR